MGHRTFLFVHEATESALTFNQCVDETNNRFALEWFAWLPQDVLDEYVLRIRGLKSVLEHEPGNSESEVVEIPTEIRIPYTEALACFRQSLLLVLKRSPELAASMRDLFLAVEEHAQSLSSPMLTLDCLQMANFNGVDNYLDDMVRHHAFWRLQMPLDDVLDSTCLHNTQSGIHTLDIQTRSKGLAEKYQKLARLEEQAYGKNVVSQKGQRWRDKHEDMLSWILAIVAAAMFFVVYFLTRSLWLGGLAFLLIAVVLTLLIYRRPAKKVLDSKVLAAIQHLKKDIQAYRAMEQNPSGNLAFDVPQLYLDGEPVCQPDSFSWDNDALHGRLWHSDQILKMPWQDIECIRYELDSEPEDELMIWSVSLTEAAHESGRYENMDVPLRFDFDEQVEPHLMLLVIRLLHRVSVAAMQQSK